MTGGKLEIAHLFIQVAAAAVALIVCGLLISKAMYAWRLWARRRCEHNHQAYFIRLQSGLDRSDALPKPEGRMSAVRRIVVGGKLMAWIDRVDGVSRDKMIALCEELGFVDREIERLQSRLSMRRTKAAYRLGMLRSKRAAPALLRELGRQRFDSSLFVIARSLALCARGADDLERMVMQIVKHRKPAHDMTVTILEEFDGDLAEVMVRLLMNGNPAARRIANLYLDKKSDMREALSTNVVAFRESSAKSKRKPVPLAEQSMGGGGR